MLEICALASGSNGNCYYIGNEKHAILVDAGISTKQILLRMEAKGLDSSKINALFITHEHRDHSCGARVLEKKLQIPVFVTEKTYDRLYNNLKPANPRFFTPNESIPLNGFTIHSFQKNHDAVDPCSFRIQHKNTNIGVMTDIGSPCENVISNIKKCDALFLETNYDEKMLWEGRYPSFLKQRVASDHGHLSNDQAFQLLQNHAGDNLKCVFLSHLSQDNNTPAKARDAIRPLSDKFEIKLTSRQHAAEIYLI